MSCEVSEQNKRKPKMWHCGDNHRRWFIQNRGTLCYHCVYKHSASWSYHRASWRLKFYQREAKLNIIYYLKTSEIIKIFLKGETESSDTWNQFQRWFHGLWYSYEFSWFIKHIQNTSDKISKDIYVYIFNFKADMTINAQASSIQNNI